MNSPTSSNDDNLPEPGIVPEQAPEPAPPAGESAVSAPPVGKSTVSAPASSLSGALPKPVSMKSGRAAAGWALLLALVSLVIAGFALWQVNEWRTQNVDLRDEVAKRLQESDQAVGESRASAQREHESINTVLGKIGALEVQINKNEGHAAALEALYQQFSRSQEDRLVAEVQQAVAVAEQQLQYAGNIEMALIALRAAQTRLEQHDHGQFTALRQALSTDIEKLSQQSTLDMPGTALRLEQVLKNIDKLPLAYSAEVSAEKRSAEHSVKGEGISQFISSLASDIWAELRSLVKFERLDTETEPVLLAPEQSAFLRENVKMRLLTARLAMLARDGHTYVTDLERACNWIERFFDMRSEEVKAIVAELRTLETVQVGVIRHELIESATAVRRFQTRGGESPPTLLPQPPASDQATVPEAPALPAQP
ncbi:MAG: uroporphyrinogen-III C-methyltransferase [Betaproteobacteria bacterium]|nr:uroporphyrinogen-III C-methyltransferase [Betaproteobacteria bacterium]